MLQPTTGETVSGTEVLNKEVIPDTYPVGDVRTTDKETVEQNLFSTTIQLVENIQASQYGQLKETELESIRGRLSPLIVIGAIKAAKIIGTAIIATPAVVNKTVPGVKVTTKKTTEIVQRAMSQAELTATQKNRVASRWAKRDTLCQQCYKF